MKKELLKSGMMLKTKKNILIYDKNLILKHGFRQPSAFRINKHQNIFIVSNKYTCNISGSNHNCWDIIIIKEGESSLKQLRLNGERVEDLFEIISS